MKRILVAVAIACVMFAASSFAGGATPTAQAQCQSVKCGSPICTWSGVVYPGNSVAPCYGYFASAWVTTSGCCYNGYSWTGFGVGYSDVRWGNVTNLHVFSQHPGWYTYFQMINYSQSNIWYSISVQ